MKACTSVNRDSFVNDRRTVLNVSDSNSLQGYINSYGLFEIPVRQYVRIKT